MYRAKIRPPKEVNIPAKNCHLTDDGKVIVDLVYCPELSEFIDKAFEIDSDRLYSSYANSDINSFISENSDELFPLYSLNGDEEKKPDTENPDFITAELIRHIFAHVNYIETVDVTKAS